MTLLNYIVKPDRIELYSDILATNSENKDNYNFRYKIFHLPHLNSIVCGAGSFDTILKWYTFIQNHIIAKDITTLDQFAPARLKEMYSELKEPINTSVYNFGFSLTDEKFVGFRYRSSNNFESEILDDCFAFKPYSEEMMQYIKDNGTDPREISGMLELIKHQKILDDQTSTSQKVGIGGKIYYCLLKDRCQFVSEVHIFEDFGEDYKTMLSKADVL